MGWDEPPDFYDNAGCPYWLTEEPDEGVPERWRIFAFFGNGTVAGVWGRSCYSVLSPLPKSEG